MTPKQVAKQILVRPAPNGGHYFNGIRSLEQAVRTVFPDFGKPDRRLQRAYLDLVARELRIVRRIPEIEKELELVAA